MSNRTFKNLSTFSIFCLMLCFWLSCRKQKHYEPVVITEDLLCELQDKFNSVSIGQGRPCQQYLNVEFYNFYNSNVDSSEYKHQIIGIKNRYNTKYNRNQKVKKEIYRDFEQYLTEMEKYGIKCITIYDWLTPENDDRFIYHEMPCTKSALIHFYADRISLSAYPTFDTIDLNQYESVSFATYPFIKDTTFITNRLPGSFWGYEFYKKPDK